MLGGEGERMCALLSCDFVCFARFLFVCFREPHPSRGNVS